MFKQLIYRMVKCPIASYGNEFGKPILTRCSNDFLQILKIFRLIELSVNFIFLQVLEYEVVKLVLVSVIIGREIGNEDDGSVTQIGFN